jgi:hypothetical protein
VLIKYEGPQKQSLKHGTLSTPNPNQSNPAESAHGHALSALSCGLGSKFSVEFGSAAGVHAGLCNVAGMEWTMPKAIKQEEWPYYDSNWSWMVCSTKQADCLYDCLCGIGSLPKPCAALSPMKTALT